MSSSTTLLRRPGEKERRRFRLTNRYSQANRLKHWLEARPRVAWYTAVFLIVIAALTLRAAGVGFALPYIVHPNEPGYYAYTLALQKDGSFGETRGGGYPPGFLALWIVEQKLIDVLAGPEMPVATDYLVARAVNAILGSTAVLLAALIARSLAGPGAGLIAALVIAVHPSFVATSSVASPDTPYTTAALLSLWLMLIARNPIRFGLIQVSLLAALAAFLTKYQALPLVGLPFLVMCFFGRSDPRFVRHLTAAAILSAGVALWLHFIYDIYQVHNIPYAYTPSLLTKDNLLIPISLGEGVTRLLVGLEPPYLFVTVFFGLLAASIRPLERGRMDWIGIGLIGLFVASFTLLMSLFQQVALSYWQPAIVFLCILWAIAVDYVAKRLCLMGTGLLRTRGLPEGISAWTARLVPGALILLLLWPLAAQSMSQAEYRGRPDSRSATVDWFLENVPSGTHIAVENNAVEFLVNAGPPRSKVFFVKVINSIRKGSLEGLVERGFEFAVADSRSENGLFHINRGERKALPARLEPVLELLNEDGHQGPDRYIFRLPRVIENPMHIFFGEPTPGLHTFNRHQLLPPVIFRGFDLRTSTVSNGESLDLALYWDAQRQLDASRYDIVLRLRGPGGITALEQPKPLDEKLTAWRAGTFFVQKRSLHIPRSVDKDEYTLTMGLKDRATKAALPALSSNGRPLEGEIQLGSISIN